MLNLSIIIIASLATFRMTRLVTIEEGPFGLALRLRGLLDPDARTWVGRGMACPWCVSFWLGPLAVLAAQHPIGFLLISGLAVSALVGLGYQTCGWLEMLWRRR
jgi:hypothetical protein